MFAPFLCFRSASKAPMPEDLFRLSAQVVRSNAADAPDALELL
ncbi:hypothetical protein [Lewinella sp. IMCC34183]|nr:hypothetical protein [Lewinella sp. IMCC34183]